MNKIEIFEEEGEKTLSISDEHHDTTLDFYPNKKEYEQRLRLKEDVYYRNELYEYKINTNPIEVFIKLKERSDEPPLRHAVKDGVVLESEILKSDEYKRFKERGEEFVINLKREVEWNKLELTGGCSIIFYILSLHPEIISKDEYKKFLRQINERIKNGLSKIEIFLKEKDHTGGLQIKTNTGPWSFGKQIWYKDDPKVSDKEYKAIVEHVEKDFYAPLFTEGKPEYSGISRNEFESSSEIMEYTDKLLNGKEKVSSKDKDASGEKQKKNLSWLGYVWTIIVNLTTIGIVFAIYSQVSGNLEIILFSILILIYLSIQSFMISYDNTTGNFLLYVNEEFGRIRKLLKNEPSKEEIEEVKEAKKKFAKAKIKISINAISLAIIFLIVLFHLIGAL